MIASLPWYDPPHLHWANDAFWQAIRAELPFDTPETLDRETDVWTQWHDPQLILSQSCSLPYRTKLHGTVHLVAAADFGLPDCSPGHYHSTIVTRPGLGTVKGARLAYNDSLSQSGWGAAEGYGVVPAVETGAHAASLDAVRSGVADVAFIDSHTLRGLGGPGELDVFGTTAPTPGTPFITARSDWVAPVFDALSAALEKLPPDTKDALGIRGFVRVEAHTYLALPPRPSLDDPASSEMALRA